MVGVVPSAAELSGAAIGFHVIFYGMLLIIQGKRLPAGGAGTGRTKPPVPPGEIFVALAI
jgi:hypothetical protein